ncbi:Bgt-55055 [Blumeria graminis f. sp. tritici]|uniref:Uncharacterized protein n=2 Tax=Blumeria graminis f. sp. tritici TaxID=62690 RepID=A0A656KKQ4_BLUGR|nr:hypothetical protein BGT96224_AcSP30038 [Blumeria graminis f. sp. tritici 96224]VCU41127.1 Bgt-55055 [Blumeria graminis f. sp. tritici]
MKFLSLRGVAVFLSATASVMSAPRGKGSKRVTLYVPDAANKIGFMCAQRHVYSNEQLQKTVHIAKILSWTRRSPSIDLGFNYHTGRKYYIYRLLPGNKVYNENFEIPEKTLFHSRTLANLINIIEESDYVVLSKEYRILGGVNFVRPNVMGHFTPCKFTKQSYAIERAQKERDQEVEYRRRERYHDDRYGSRYGDRYDESRYGGHQYMRPGFDSRFDSNPGKNWGHGRYGSGQSYGGHSAYGGKKKPGKGKKEKKEGKEEEEEEEEKEEEEEEEEEKEEEEYSDFELSLSDFVDSEWTPPDDLKDALSSKILGAGSSFGVLIDTVSSSSGGSSSGFHLSSLLESSSITDLSSSYESSSYSSYSAPAASYSGGGDYGGGGGGGDNSSDSESCSIM